MELQEAILDLINSEAFKTKAKKKDAEGGKYRMFLTRHNRGDLKTGAAIEMLLEHGYKLDIKKPKR